MHQHMLDKLSGLLFAALAPKLVAGVIPRLLGIPHYGIINVTNPMR
jgi:hypothetical protein